MNKHFYFDDVSKRYFVYETLYDAAKKLLSVDVFPYPSDMREFNYFAEFLNFRCGQQIYEIHKRSTKYEIDVNQQDEFKETFLSLMRAMRTSCISDDQIGAVPDLEQLTNEEFMKWWKSEELRE